MKRVSPQTLAKHCADLRDPVQHILQLWAVTGGISNTLTLTLLRKAAISPPRGQQWNSSDLSAIEHTLRERELVDERHRCCPELEHVLVRNFVRNCASALKESCALREALLLLPEASTPLRLRLHLALSFGDSKRYTRATESARNSLKTNNTFSCLWNLFWLSSKHSDRDSQHSPDPSLPLAGFFTTLPPEAEDWFSTLPPAACLDIIASNTALLLKEGRVTPCLPWLLRHLPALRPQLEKSPPIPALMLLDILSGRFTEAKAQIVPLLLEKDEPLGPALLATCAFFENRNPDALTHFREARKRFRRLFNKRRLQLHGIPGLCFVLALIRAEDPALHEEVDEILSESQLNTLEGRGFFAAGLLLQLARNTAPSARLLLQNEQKLPPREPFSTALFFGVQLLIANPRTLEPTAQHLPQRETVSALFETYRDILPLTACLFAEILARLAPNPEPYTTFLFEQKPKIALLSFFSQREHWERQFDMLEHALCPKDRANRAKKSASTHKKRLAWLLDPETFELEPLEQTCKITKSGELWSSGRLASLKRLFEHSRTLDWLTEQDRLLLDTLELEQSWNGRLCHFKSRKTLPRLVGHPLLFEAVDRRPLTLRQENVELVVKQQGKGYLISLSHFFGKSTLQLVKEAPDAYCLYLLPEALENVSELLAHGLKIPERGAARVLQFLREYDSAVAVRPEIHAEEILVADARPIARLKPLGTGLEVTLLVRPFGVETPPAPETTKTAIAAKEVARGAAPPTASAADVNPVFPPGQGNPQPLSSRQGTTLRAHRDLDAERAAAETLCCECPVLQEQGGLGPWLLEDTEKALQCLLELQSAPGCAGLEWPEGQRLRVRPAVSAANMTVQVRSSQDWFQLEGSVRINESLVLDMRRILDHLAEAKGCFVPLGDGEFLTLTRQFRQQLERLQRLCEPADARREPSDPKTAVKYTLFPNDEPVLDRKKAPRSAVRVHALGIGAVQAILDEAGCVDTDAAWHDLAKRIRDAEAATPVVPSTLRAQLRDYQVEGFAWLSRLSRWAGGACLADDMGLGKTVQTIALLLEQAQHGPSLVFAPTSVCHNWESELIRFAPTLTCHRFSGTRAARAELVRSLGPGDVLVTSYGLLHLESTTLATREWRMVVFDEAQALKNAETKRARASKQIPAVFRVALTGTPIENYLEDLWSLFATICPGLLGTKHAFQRRFSGPIGAGGIGLQQGGQSALGGTGAGEARQALKALVRPFILRRTKSAVLTELPPRTEQVIAIDLPEEERAFYEALRRNALDILEKKKDAAATALDTGFDPAQKLTILTELTKLRRACCHPALIDPQTQLKGAKLSACMELANELVRGGHKALIFSQFTGYLAYVRQALDRAGLPYQYLDGSTPERERQRSVKAFQSGEGDLFLISLKAGGQGLNLTAADYVIHLDPWWNPAVEDQASDRAHRMGQKRPVTVYRLVVRDSIEERILKLHRSKRSLAADFLEGADVSAALSAQELLELITGSEPEENPAY